MDSLEKCHMFYLQSEIDLLKELNVSVRTLSSCVHGCSDIEQHPNVVKYLGFTKSKIHLNIIMEYCQFVSFISLL